jgi:hypothetical protein
VRVGSGADEELIEQDPGAAGFAARDQPAGQVGGPGDVVRVPGRNDQPLLAPPQAQQVRVVAV